MAEKPMENFVGKAGFFSQPSECGDDDDGDDDDGDGGDCDGEGR